jgi:PEGA domain-containing protein
MRLRVLSLVALVLTLIPVSLLAQSAEQSVEPVSAKPETTEAAAPVADDAKSKQESSDKDAPGEKRKFRLRLGGVSVGAGYSHFSGPHYYPYAYPFGYAPFGFYPGDWVAASFWYPIASPYPYYATDAFRYGDGRGEIRLTADPKEAKVYIDGGYAGTADKLKTLWLDPGAYDLTVSAAGRGDFHQRLYVLSGKSLKISAKLEPEQTKETP